MLRMATADRFTAIALFALGAAMTTGGWTMDRLEIRKIHPASIPGLVPIILGILLAICAVALWQASRAAESEQKTEHELVMAGGSLQRLLITGGLCILYSLVLVGLLPFTWATAAFVSVFNLIFSWPDAENKLRATIFAVLFGIIIAFGVSALFEHAFLVRLP